VCYIYLFLNNYVDYLFANMYSYRFTIQFIYAFLQQVSQCLVRDYKGSGFLKCLFCDNLDHKAIKASFVFLLKAFFLYDTLFTFCKEVRALYALRRLCMRRNTAFRSILHSSGERRKRVCKKSLYI
jgi:hypothetical protein